MEDDVEFSGRNFKDLLIHVCVSLCVYVYTCLCKLVCAGIYNVQVQRPEKFTG